MWKPHQFIYNYAKLRYVCAECGAEMHHAKRDFTASAEYMSDPAIRGRGQVPRHRRSKPRAQTESGTYLRAD